MSESFESKTKRWVFNFFPAFRRSGGRITYIDRNWREVRLELRLTWRTRNYVGTIFGGSMFAAVDPIYMIMFIKLLGPRYIVWDKAATIQFKRPGRSTLRATFVVAEAELETIKIELESNEKLDRNYRIELVDEQGMVCAVVEKTLHFRHKDTGGVKS
jgi:acyl-coenzyme A thioesterase PaaI-like protein